MTQQRREIISARNSRKHDKSTDRSVRVRGEYSRLTIAKRKWWHSDILGQKKGTIALLTKTEGEKYHLTFISDKI